MLDQYDQYDQPDLAHAEPDTLRYRLWHLPARLTHHAPPPLAAHQPDLAWRDAFVTCWQRLCALPVLGLSATSRPDDRRK